MENIFRNVYNYFIQPDQNNQPVAQNSAVHNSIQSCKEESKDVMLAGQEIERAFSMFEEGRFEETVGICEALHTHTINNCSQPEVKIIKDKLFEAGLEISFAGKKDIARKILLIADSPAFPDSLGTIGQTYHREAGVCWSVLGSYSRSLDASQLKRVLEKAIPEKEHLKCAPYFLGKVYAEGLYGVAQNEVKAKEYLDIADKRGYKPRNLVPFKKQGEEYKMMLEAQQSKKSVFADVPTELVNHIARLRFAATLAQPKPDKKSDEI